MFCSTAHFLSKKRWFFDKNTLFEGILIINLMIKYVKTLKFSMKKKLK